MYGEHVTKPPSALPHNAMANTAALLALSCAALLALASCLDPEVNMDAIQLITSKGYPAERHYTTTRDGYILQMHRIPYSPKHPYRFNTTRPVFFLQHGLLGSSTNWLTNLVNESFAYVLADAGFDVWMGNIRGNTYCRNHTHLTPHDKAFWNFTFDQHSLIDLPTMVDKVIEVSGQNRIFYAGHSQGTIMGFAGFSTNQTLASHIKAFFALAPVTTVKHVEGPLSILAPFFGVLEFFLDKLGTGEFLPSDAFTEFLEELFCSLDKELEDYCRDILFLICGFDVPNINVTRIPVYVSHNPAGTSVKNLAHYDQEHKSGKFCMYDYGEAGNLREYGTPNPPQYNLTELHVPTALFTGSHDWLADPEDVQNLIPKIKQTIFNHTNFESYEHLDFIWGMSATDLVYKVIINMTQRFL